MRNHIPCASTCCWSMLMPEQQDCCMEQTLAFCYIVSAKHNMRSYPCSVDMHCIHWSSWKSVLCWGRDFYYCYYFANYIKLVNLWITLHWWSWIIKFSKKACVHFPCPSSVSSSMSSIPPLSPQQCRLQQKNWGMTEAFPLMTFIFPHGIHKIRHILRWRRIITDCRKDHLGIQPDKISCCLGDLAQGRKGPRKILEGLSSTQKGHTGKVGRNSYISEYSDNTEGFKRFM